MFLDRPFSQPTNLREKMPSASTAREVDHGELWHAATPEAIAADLPSLCFRG